MPVGMTEDQKLMSDSVRKFIQENYDHRTRIQTTESETGFNQSHWALFAEQGWLSAAVTEENGGLGLTDCDTVVLVEELGRGNFSSPFWSSAIFAGEILSKAGDNEIAANILQKMLAGEVMVSVAYAEPNARFTLAAVETEATQVGGGYRLSGEKHVVMWAGCSDHLIVTARTSGKRDDKNGITLFLVDTHSEGVSLTSYETNDGQRASNIILDGVLVDENAVLGIQEEGYQLFEQACDRAMLFLAAEAVGCIGALHDQTLDYLKQREQFGRPIAKFQVMQHMMVDMNTELQTATAMVYAAAHHRSLDIPDTEKSRMISAAKAQVGWSGRKVGEMAIQLHGGIGMTYELPIGHYHKRLVAIDRTLGDADFHLRRFQKLDSQAAGI